MGRTVDPKRTRKALRQLRRLKALQDGEQPPDFSTWENDFIGEVEQRLDTYGSAFADLRKGRSDEALSTLQAIKLRELERKAKGKPIGGFRRKKPAG